ncbi:MAG: ROK family transcriptional regulator [Firmicutes bacterium]|nr:ROK family transcriptional regulator [Bacillota bacterium]
MLLHHEPGTPQLMGQMNRATVINILTKLGPISQTQICDLTGLSRATVSTIIADLRKEELVVAVSRAASTSGRRRVLLELNGDAGYVIGVDLGGTNMAGAVTNLLGKVIYSLKQPTCASDGPEAVFQSLLRFIRRLAAESQIDQGRIKGVGIGIPGVVVKGREVQWAPSLKWKDYPLVDTLSAHIDFPIFLENDVNLQALGEYWYGLGQGVDVLVCLAIGTGLGAGIVINGQVFFGSHQAAGEVGNLVLDTSQLGQPYPGFGFLESWASGSAIGQRYMEFSGSSELVDAETVFKLARQDDPIALKVVKGFSEHLAMAIVSISTVLDPELIILGGGVAKEADLFLPKLEELALPVLQTRPRLVASELGDIAGVMGAVALTLHNTNGQLLSSYKRVGE